MTRFEHQRLVVPHFGANAHGNPVDSTLEEMGALGWELVTVAEGAAQTTLYFKRAKIPPIPMPLAIPAVNPEQREKLTLPQGKRR